MAGYVLSESDGDIIRQLILREQQRQRNLRTRDAPADQEGQPSDVYIAHVPAAGIPAMTSTGGAGTGSPALHGDTPGSAHCAVYRRLPGRMLPVGLNLTVYNYSTTAISGNKWIPVAKEKFGDWTALSQEAGSGGTGTFSGARASISSNKTIPNSSATAVSFDAADLDTDGYFDTGTPNQFTVPTSGTYLIGGYVVWAQAPGDVNTVLTVEGTSGDGTAYSQHDFTPTGLFLQSESTASGLLILTAGDTVDMEVTQFSGGDLDLVNASFWITKVG